MNSPCKHPLAPHRGLIAQDIAPPADGEFALDYALRVTRAISGIILSTAAREAVDELVEDLVYICEKHDLIMTEAEKATAHNLPYLQRMVETLGAPEYIEAHSANRREADLLLMHLDEVYKRIEALPTTIPLTPELLFFADRASSRLPTQ